MCIYRRFQAFAQPALARKATGMKYCTVLRASTLRPAFACALVSLIALSILASCARLLSEYSKIHRSSADSVRSRNFYREYVVGETETTRKRDERVQEETDTDSLFQLYRQCTVDECLQLQSCGMWQRLRFYVYDYGALLRDVQPEHSFTVLYESLLASHGASSDADSACLYFVVVTDSVVNWLYNLLGSERQLSAALLRGFQERLGMHLSFFNRGNHVFLLAPTQRRVPTVLLDALSNLPVVLASSSGSRRTDFDVTTSSFLPVLRAPLVSSSADNVWRFLPTILPIRRRYLASFHGALINNHSNPLMETLARLMNQHGDSFAIESNCTIDEQLREIGEQGDWLPCYDAQRRYDLLRNSTFCLVPGYWRQSTTTRTSSELMQARVLECLVNGAVPLLLGTSLELPFASQLSWQRASLRLPITRASQLHEVLAALDEHEIAELRRAGRLFAEQRLATVSAQLHTLLNILRDRLAIMPTAVRDVHAPSVFVFTNETDPGWIAASRFEPTRADLPTKENVSANEPLGPCALAARDSPIFRANRTQAVWMTASFGGTLFGADWLLPNSPFTPPLPNDAQFRGSDGFQPIKDGLGGVSTDFSAALGGNRRPEQFTVLIVSYKREEELILAVQRLKNVPHLHSIIVVWNGPARPAANLVWPNISTPVHVVKPARNSLNNRFLPLDLIRTEAVLTLDDDVALRQDEIVFGFRAWRDTPDRIVGFPARYHAWHKQSRSFKYSFWPTCEYSMVLTGAAFVHKFYFYQYTYVQPSAVRALVDELMNCEDIAMNMLVSHITRKPPIKVTNRWNFPCTKCSPGDAVSARAGHYERRSECLNRLMQIYGYNPLLMTQTRLDSVLYMMNEHDVAANRRCFRNV